MRRAPVYRNLAREPEWLGLEPADALLVGTFAWVLQTFVKPGFALMVAATALIYVALRLWKRGKERGYTLTVVRYALRSRRAVLVAGEPDHEGRQQPFEVQTGKELSGAEGTIRHSMSDRSR
jgi:hypothetical protein